VRALAKQKASPQAMRVSYGPNLEG